MAQVPSAIRELILFVPSMLMYSSMLSFLVACLEIVVFLAKPLRVGVGAIELVSCFIKLELAGFRGLRRFCQKACNLGRVERLKTTSRVDSLPRDTAESDQ